MCAVVDALYADPRLARLYDLLHRDRPDLQLYTGMAGEFGARTVIDVGCGTGTLACLLAERGMDVIGVDPADASLDIARAKPGSHRVRWVQGDVAALPDVHVDLVTMTANVAQVFLADDEWAATLAGLYARLRPGGRLVFESRDPARRAWERWTREHTTTQLTVPGSATVTSWVEVTAVRERLVSFTETFAYGDGETLTSDSVLRFRDREELVEAVTGAGFDVDGIRDAPDRPGRELVVVARRPV